MHVATWVIAERQQMLAQVVERWREPRDGARGTLATETRTAVADIVFRAIETRLCGGELHPASVEAWRTTYGVGALLSAAQTVAAVLRERAAIHGGSEANTMQARRQISDATDEVMMLVDPDGGVPIELDGPRPTLVHALSEFAARPITSADAPARPRTLLRVRASNAAAARVLRDARQALSQNRAVRVEASAPDELMVLATESGVRGVETLIQVASDLAQQQEELFTTTPGTSDKSSSSEEASTPPKDPPARQPLELAAAIVLVSNDVTDAALDAGGMLRPGLLVFGDSAWQHIASRAALLRGEERAVDPRTPYLTDRVEQAALLLRPVVVGRAAQIAVITSFLTEHTDGGDSTATVDGSTPSETPDPSGQRNRARLLLLHGAAGMGKSSVVRASLDAAGYTDARAPVLWGSAQAAVPTPYAAWVAMLRAASGATAGAADARRRVLSMLEVLAPGLPNAQQSVLMRAADALLVLLGERVATEHRAPRSWRVAIRRALVSWLDAVWSFGGGNRPVVVVVTVAEQLDATSRETFDVVARALRGRLRFVFLSSHRLRLATLSGSKRSGKSAPALGASITQPNPTLASSQRSMPDGASAAGPYDVLALELPPLEQSVVREIAGHMLGAPCDDTLAARLMRTRGNPLGVAHTVRWAVESGWLRVGEGSGSGFDMRDVPSRIDKLLQRRVQLLSDERRLLLGACALVGPVVSPEAAELCGVRLGMSRDDVLRALQVFSETGYLLRREPRPGRPLFAHESAATPAVPRSAQPLVFEHPMLRDAALACVPDADRSRLHAAAADALSAASAADSVAMTAAIARHALSSGNVDAAREPLLAGARRALLLEDVHLAAELARDGIDASTQDPHLAFPFLLQLVKSRAYGPRRQHADAVSDLLTAAQNARDPRLRARALIEVARFNMRCGDTPLAAQACGRALAEVRGLGEHAVELEALRLSAVVSSRLGDVGAVRELASAIEAREHADAPRTRASLRLLEGQAHLASGHVVTAIQVMCQAFASARALNDEAAESSCLEALALAYAQANRPDVAVDMIDRAQVRVSAFGEAVSQARLAELRASMFLACGDEQRALSAAEHVRVGYGTLDTETDSDALLLQVRALLMLGEHTQAEPLIELLRKRAPRQELRAATGAVQARAKLARALKSSGQVRSRLLKTAQARARDALEQLDNSHRQGADSGEVPRTTGVFGMPVPVPATGAATNGRRLPVMIQASAALAEAQLLDGDTHGAFAHAQLAFELIEDAPAGPWQEEALWVRLQVAHELGDDEDRNETLRVAQRLLQARAARLDDDARARFWRAPLRAALKSAIEAEGGATADGKR